MEGSIVIVMMPVSWIQILAIIAFILASSSMIYGLINERRRAIAIKEMQRLNGEYKASCLKFMDKLNG